MFIIALLSTALFGFLTVFAFVIGLMYLMANYGESRSSRDGCSFCSSSETEKRLDGYPSCNSCFYSDP